MMNIFRKERGGTDLDPFRVSMIVRSLMELESLVGSDIVVNKLCKLIWGG
jgi:hypothetical protein